MIKPDGTVRHSARTAATARRPGKHLPQLDILRGIAILLVMLYHQTEGFRYGHFPWHGRWRIPVPPVELSSILGFPLLLGWAGVALFFVLSGFCIHLSFRRHSEFEVGRFFAQRFWRIYPAYLAALVCFAVLGTIRTGAPPSPVQVATHLALVHNFTRATCFGINGSFWSLAVEMQLYALYPLVLTLRERWGMPRCLAVALIIGMGWRLFAWKAGGLENPPITSFLTAPPMTWFDWCLGAYVAERYADGAPAFPASLTLGLSSAALLVVSMLYKPATVLSFSLAAVLSAVVLDNVVRKDLS